MTRVALQERLADEQGAPNNESKQELADAYEVARAFDDHDCLRHAYSSKRTSANNRPIETEDTSSSWQSKRLTEPFSRGRSIGVATAFEFASSLIRPRRPRPRARSSRGCTSGAWHVRRCHLGAEHHLGRALVRCSYTASTRQPSGGTSSEPRCRARAPRWVRTAQYKRCTARSRSDLALVTVRPSSLLEVEGHVAQAGPGALHRVQSRRASQRDGGRFVISVSLSPIAKRPGALCTRRKI